MWHDINTNKQQYIGYFELIFYQLAIYHRINGDLLWWATEFNEMPCRIHILLPLKTTVRSYLRSQCVTWDNVMPSQVMRCDLQPAVPVDEEHFYSKGVLIQYGQQEVDKPVWKTTYSSRVCFGGRHLVCIIFNHNSTVPLNDIFNNHGI